MSQQDSDRPAPVTNIRVAEEVRSVRMFDPGLGAYAFEDLGQAVQFADLMSKAGPMLPLHCQRQPAICLGITMRAVHWGFDPFALAMESYQAKDGGPVGYQAKVFVAALRNAAKITLRYRYEGTITMLDKPVLSHNGREIAKRTATGDRRCIAWAIVDGERLEYESLTLDEITIKNSPLWHNDPDQQLAYYTGRGWVRRYRPDVIMGAHSPDEVDEMSREMKDVTPKQTGFERLAMSARAETKEPAQDKVDHDAEAEEQSATSDPYLEGSSAAIGGMARSTCPYRDDRESATLWLAGFDSVLEGQDDESEAG